MENQAQYSKTSEIFKKAIHEGLITKTEYEIYLADKETPIVNETNPELQLKEVLHQFFLLYGIDPGKQFADQNFKELFLAQVIKMIERYFPTISKHSIVLAIELNLINYFNLVKKPEVYGDRLTANFLMEILNAYKYHKGKIVQKCEKIIPKEEPVPDIEATKADLIEMMHEDFAKLRAGNMNALRFPTFYYDILVEQGEIVETEEYLQRLLNYGKDVVKSIKNVARMRQSAPLSIKELGYARNILNSNMSGQRVAIAKSQGVTEYALNHVFKIR